MYMVMLVLDDPRRLDAVLAAWRAAGVAGVTLAETTGAYRRTQQPQHIPARYAIGLTPDDIAAYNYTLWVIVPDLAMAQRCLTEVEAVVGDLDGPDTGVLAAWPLALVKGVPEPRPADA